MSGVSRVGTDAAGGLIQGDLAPTVSVNGAHIAVKGAAVAGHGLGPHAGPVMSGSSSTVFANGIEVVRAGDSASCGDAASGSSDVLAG